MGVTAKLKIMVFLQFFVWGAWLVTLGSYMMHGLGFSGAQVGLAYSTKGLAALIMPALAGVVADRCLAANRLYGLLHLLGAVALLAAAQASEPSAMFWALLCNAAVYMPTIALANTISYAALERAGMDATRDFPGIRVYGTLGFICAMWTVSLAGLELSAGQLYLASAAALLLAVFSLSLPCCPVARARQGASWASLLGLDALVLFKNRQVAVFLLFSMLLGAALQVSNTFANPYLHDFRLSAQHQDSVVVTYPALLLSVSQMAEVVFILAIPFVLSRYGIKTVVLASMLAWVLRFSLFAVGGPSGLGLFWLMLSMVVYGCAFDFFNISGALYMEQQADSRIRASAQGLFMTMVNGVGAYGGSLLGGWAVDAYTEAGLRQWPQIWFVFAVYSLVLALSFALVFRPRNAVESASVAA